MAIDRADLLERSREATLKANVAQERVAAWAMISRALLRLMLAYEGNPLHETIKTWYDTIVKEKAERQPKLEQTVERERAIAEKTLREHNETPHF